MSENVNTVRRLLLRGGAGFALSSLAVHGAAKTWPVRPICLVTGYAPGGSSDITARSIGAPLARLLGQPLVVDNKPGAQK